MATGLDVTQVLVITYPPHYGVFSYTHALMNTVHAFPLPVSLWHGIA